MSLEGHEMGNRVESIRRPVDDTAPSAASQDRPTASPWLVRGVADIYFQREAQVTWWTVLGGIAVGALLTQLLEVVSQVQTGRWSLVLYFLATALVIALSWVQTTWGTLVLRWPISIASALLGFFAGISQSVLSLQVTRPSDWAFAAFLVALSSVLSQLYFQRSGAWVAFDPEYVVRLKGVVWTHGAFGGVALLTGLLLRKYPTPFHETLCGLVALSIVVVALFLQDRGMSSEKTMLHIP